MLGRRASGVAARVGWRALVAWRRWHPFRGSALVWGTCSPSRSSTASAANHRAGVALSRRPRTGSSCRAVGFGPPCSSCWPSSPPRSPRSFSSGAGFSPACARGSAPSATIAVTSVLFALAHWEKDASLRPRRPAGRPRARPDPGTHRHHRRHDGLPRRLQRVRVRPAAVRAVATPGSRRRVGASGRPQLVVMLVEVGRAGRRRPAAPWSSPRRRGCTVTRFDSSLARSTVDCSRLSDVDRAGAVGTGGRRG